jgi:DNA-binding HxlR family transcriptional regulator
MPRTPRTARAAAPAAGAGDESGSPLAAALDSVGDRWTLRVVEALLDGPRRFGDLESELQGIAPNVLSQRLRRLEGEGLVLTQPYSERPPRFIYELTAAGRELAGALRLLADWGARHREGTDPPRHVACGTPVAARWWCPSCDQAVDEPEAADLHFA